jgi:hypothetical protein
MNECLTTASCQATTASPPAPAEPCADFQPVAVALELASSSALLTVLSTVARLGCRTTHGHATERGAALGVLAPRQVAHQLLPCLEQLVEVLRVVEGRLAHG